MRIDLLLLLYNRPEHTLSTLEGLAANGIERVKAYLDYSDKPEVMVNQDKIRDIVRNFKGCEITLVERTAKMGLARSVRGAMDTAFADGADAAILLEDDCVLRPGGYEFFRQGLHELKDNKQIRSLCGYLFPNCNFIFDPEADLLLLHRFSTWGWATWADRWKQYEVDLAKVVALFDTIGLNIDDYATDMGILSRSQKFLKGEVDIWSVPWILLHYLTSTFAVYPKEAVIDNIGLDGSGANCEDTEVFKTGKASAILNTYNWRGLNYFLENEEIIKDFMAINGLKTYPKP
jgi:hypothetical protein